MSERAKSITVAAYLLLCLILGGSAQGMWANLALQIFGVAIIALAAIARARTSEEGIRSPLPNLLLLAAILVILLQLIPLPASLWSRLPGREPIAAGLQALGYPLPPMPLSEAPYASVRTLFAIIPAIAAYVGTQALRPSPRSLFLGIVAGTALGIVVGALQVAGGPHSWAYFYSISSRGAVGFFANGNHMGTLLLIAIPTIAALIGSAKSERRASKSGRNAIAIAVLGLVLVGIALNGSFAAFGLAIPVIIASAAVVPAGFKWRRLALSAASLLLLAAVGLMAAKPIGSDVLERQSSTSLSSRMEIWRTTNAAIADTMPVGSGLGTFTRVYHLHENPDQVGAEYVNHAHNDYLELVLELGLPGLILLLAFLGWWGVVAARIWSSQLSTPFARAATVATAAVLAHSIVDFPLRTAAISAVFGAAIALMAQHLGPAVAAKRGEKRPTRHVKLG